MKTPCIFLGNLVFALLLPTFTWAGAVITYHGRLLDQNDQPLEAANVTFRIRIFSPSPKKCLLYEESRTVNMTASQGVFVIPIGDGSGTRSGDDPGLTIENIFANNGTTISNLVCNSTSSYTSQTLDQREMIVSYDDHTGYGWDNLPSMALNYVPFSVNSHDTQNVGGTAAKSVLRVVDPNPANPAFDATPLTPAGFTQLMSLINGTSTQYEKAGKLNGTTVPSLTNGQVLGWNGGAWTAVTPMTSYTETDPSVKSFAKSNLPTCAANSFLKNDGSGNLVCVVASGTASGTVTSVAAGTGLKTDQASNAAITSSGTLAVDVGTGANQVVQLDSSSKLPAVDGSLLTNVVASSLSSSASINISGDIVSSNGNIQTNKSLTAKDALYLYDAKTPTPSSVGLKAPANVTASYILTLPTAQGTSGQVLGMSATTGQLSWISPSTGTVTSVTASAPLASSGGATPNISLPKVDATQDGYLSKTDFSAFNNKQPAGNYITTLTGDVTSSAFSSGSVTTTIANSAVTATKMNFGGVNSATSNLVVSDSTGKFYSFGCSTAGQVATWTVAGWGCAATSINALNDLPDVYVYAPGNVIFFGPGTSPPATESGGTGGNTVFGAKAMAVNQNGGQNTAFGAETLSSSTSSSENSAFGWQALLSNTTGQLNTSIGAESMIGNTTGSENSAIGTGALGGIGSGNNNSAIGAWSGQGLKSGSYNVIIGSQAVGSSPNSSTFNNNTIVGSRSARYLTTGADANVVLGYQAANNLTTGANNIIIGNNISAVTATSSNTLNIGNLIFANSVDGTGTTLSTGKVGIGVNSPAYKLDVAGDINTSTCFRIGASVVSGTCASDQRLKENIQDYSQGLKELLSVRLRTYRFNGLGEMPKTGETAVGVIAQELEQTNPDLVKPRLVKMHPEDTELTEIKTVDYSKFSYMLINAVKELYAKLVNQDQSLEIHNRQILALQKENAELKARLDRLEKSMQGSQ
ncbi:tail fiber domain-containing protein [Bdellovibrio sp. NC01]|uniref:tail fiber domain-containing protein n=1 Tax=Bdellovibrio sp. NC01 TaxID=2220073 RepID=UPI0011571FF6|nr:tail fiber domain-containing protein [Bdellovibrio sp. NC01]QDK39242.1 hypothetical protein DOE51_17420 [Bdellovibrio sp. NC01]